jgi:hypothetical protein
MLRARSGAALALAIALSAVVMSAPASAQTTTAAILGTVVDPQGEIVPGATVTVVHEGTNETRVTTSDADRGTFQITSLAPGTYTVRVELQGFNKFERKGVVVSSSDRVSIGTIRMTVGGLEDTVTVQATGAHVNTEETQHGGVITRTQIEQVQVLGRDVTSLMRLLPGVRYTTPVDSMGGTFGVDVPNVGGLPADWSKVIIDGVVANEVGNSGMQAQMVNLDAIAEVRLLNNSYRAEYGQSGGSQLQIVTRGGTSNYHGSGYWYVRHEKLNSVEFFRARSQRLNGVDPFPPKYRFQTYGANIGGPMLGKQSRKLFFFYSLESPLVKRPQSVQTWRMPSALERNGDFSQTFDAQGRMINIRDPRKVGLACNAVNGGPGCFDGNIIPASMINPNAMQAMMRIMPLPEYDPRTTQGNYNYDTEEVIDIPKLNNIARIDWRPTANDSFSFTIKDWWQDQRGARITAGPSNWQWFFAHYKNTDRGFSGNYTKVFRSNLVWDTDFGSRRQTEVFYPLNDAEWTKASRTAANFTVPQFHPELNPRDVLPKVAFGVPGGSPNFTYDSRLSDRGVAWLTSVRSNMTYIRGSHSLKGGLYYERSYNSEGRGGVGGGAWAGDYNFSVDSANTLDTNYGYANALLGHFTSYTETDGFADVKGTRPTVEFYGQDTWKVTRTLTVDYGMRFLWFRPWASTSEGTRSASFDPDRYVPGGSPLLYRPVRVNGVNLAQNTLTGELRPNVYVGSFVPGTGDPYNGMVTNDEWPSYGVGFRVSQGIQPEGRLGFAWDIRGDGKTSLHGSLGRYHNAFVNANGLDILARQPPAQNNPILRYSTIDQLLTPEARAAFDLTPSAITGFQHVAPTPKSLNYSIGVQRELGWGTVLDVTYAGSRTRNIEVTYQINDLPYGANFIDVHPENIDPRTGGVLPANFLRPYRGFAGIGIRQNTGETDYNSMQVQLNRRYVRGLQFALAYTLAKGYDTRVTSPYVAAEQEWFWKAPTGSTQLHNLTVSYTWDVPHGSRLWNNALVRGAFDGWQLSGNTAFVSGDWAGVTFSTTDNFDFYGGGAGGRIVLTGVDPRSGNTDPNPDGNGSYLNWAAFARPSGRLDLGNAPQRFFRLPWIKNTDLALFKNFEVGRGRRMQFRWEIYNLFNTVNWSGIDTSAQFNQAGEQVDAQFGKATSARDPRIMQASIRLSF